MLEIFVIINLIYWFVWRPISFILRWIISKDEEYLESMKESDPSNEPT